MLLTLAYYILFSVAFITLDQLWFVCQKYLKLDSSVLAGYIIGEGDINMYYWCSKKTWASLCRWCPQTLRIVPKLSGVTYNCELCYWSVNTRLLLFTNSERMIRENSLLSCSFWELALFYFLHEYLNCYLEKSVCLYHQPIKFFSEAVVDDNAYFALLTSGWILRMLSAYF